jgi:peroxiredoxin
MRRARMSIRCAGLFGAVALLGTVLAALSFPLEGAEKVVCDSKRRVANLNFTLKDMNGKDVALSAHRGKVILLDFWATWCGPCKIEIPGFVELYTKYESQGFVVLGVSVDDPVAKLKPYAAQFKMNYPVLVGLGRDDLQDAFGPLLGYPTSFLIGRDGKICTQHTGLAPKEQFEREIKTLM